MMTDIDTIKVEILLSGLVELREYAKLYKVVTTERDNYMKKLVDLKKEFNDFKTKVETK